MVSTQPLAYLPTLDQVLAEIHTFKEGMTVAWSPITHFNHVKVSFKLKVTWHTAVWAPLDPRAL